MLIDIVNDKNSDLGKGFVLMWKIQEEKCSAVGVSNL
jgi:hypothetical protein